MEKSLIEKLNPNWYSLTIVNLIIFGVLMLFYKELPEVLKLYLIPSLVVYTMGNGFIGQIQGSYFRANGMKTEFKEPLKIYYSIYVAWFVCFISYLFYRGVI